MSDELQKTERDTNPEILAESKQQPPKKSEIARIVTDKLLISNEVYSCTLIKNRIISAEEQRQELESIIIKKGDKVVMNLKKKDDVKNFIDLCMNLSMQLTRDAFGQGISAKPAPSVPQQANYMALPDGTAIDDVTQYTDQPRRRGPSMPTNIPAGVKANEVEEAFAAIDRFVGKKHGAVDENPYAALQRKIDSDRTITESMGMEGLTEDQLTPEQKAHIAQTKANFGKLMGEDAQRIAQTKTSVQATTPDRRGPSKLKLLRDRKLSGKLFGNK